MNLRIKHESTSTLKHMIGSEKSLLGAIFFGDPTPIAKPQFPVLQVNIPLLNGDYPASKLNGEVWFNGNAEAIHSGSTQIKDGEIQYRHDGDFLFGVLTLAETVKEPHTPALQSTATQAYQHIFALLDEYPYPEIYRFWNYMPNINEVTNGLERYRQFNVGRHNAFKTRQNKGMTQPPAACALGVASGPLSIAFLAGRTPAQPIENPRQLSAYEYPKQYGPSSPNFSRATLLKNTPNNYAVFFISGTASIVGHRTLHAGNVIAQTQETVKNLLALIDQANTSMALKNKLRPQNALYRVYLRHPQDLMAVQQTLNEAFGATVNAVFVQADICRDDLLLEIEATLFSN